MDDLGIWALSMCLLAVKPVARNAIPSCLPGRDGSGKPGAGGGIQNRAAHQTSACLKTGGPSDQRVGGSFARITGLGEEKVNRHQRRFWAAGGGAEWGQLRAGLKAKRNSDPNRQYSRTAVA
jgi:hypothetical protein